MNNEIRISVPTDFVQIQPFPGDPAGAVVYAKQNDGSRCIVKIFPINRDKSMSFGDESSVVNGVHSVLYENQGLIEVKSGMCASGKNYIYSIVKTRVSYSNGMQYILTMHVDYESSVLCVQSFFEENGMSGVRDNYILEQVTSQGIISADMNGWARDPYDVNYTKGLLMNMSENVMYDSMFPMHPLSMTRGFIDYFVSNN